MRSNARSGDYIWVSGTIGDAALGLDVALGRCRDVEGSAAAWLRGRYQLPCPRVALGSALIGLAHAAMDVSDGLVGDLGHICQASGVGAVIEAAKIPLSPAFETAMQAGSGDLTKVLTGGDDYELLFTAPASATDRVEGLTGSLGLRLTPIGRIIDSGGVRVIGPSGRPVDVSTGGYRHFGG